MTEYLCISPLHYPFKFSKTEGGCSMTAPTVGQGPNSGQSPQVAKWERYLTPPIIGCFLTQSLIVIDRRDIGVAFLTIQPPVSEPPFPVQPVSVRIFAKLRISTENFPERDSSSQIPPGSPPGELTSIRPSNMFKIILNHKRKFNRIFLRLNLHSNNASKEDIIRAFILKFRLNCKIK